MNKEKYIPKSEKVKEAEDTMTDIENIKIIAAKAQESGYFENINTEEKIILADFITNLPWDIDFGNQQDFKKALQKIADYRIWCKDRKMGNLLKRRLEIEKFTSEEEYVKWELQQPENLFQWKSVPQHGSDKSIDFIEKINSKKIKKMVQKIETLGGDTSDYKGLLLLCDYINAGSIDERPESLNVKMPDEETIKEILKRYEQ